CSRGDFAFTTITFGQWNVDDYDDREKGWLYNIGKIMLSVRRQGHGKDGKPVVFPKLVFLYDAKQIAADPFSKGLFDEAVKTSSQCMYPDYLSLSSEYGSVSEIFQKYGAITSPMGCRAFLSLWRNEEGKAITIGRCNIGAVSLNLPIILRLTQLEHPDNWKEAFWNVLDERLEVIRCFLKKRYDIVRHQKCSSNPLCFTQGGLYEGTKSPDDTVGDLVRYMTASFGITAFDEFTYLWTGKRLVDEGGEISAQVLRHLKEKLAQFKAEDGYLYAIYGTPAESLCATQAKQYNAFCADRGIDNVFAHTEHYSKEYFTNSFHVNVTENITPFEKQDHEFQDFHLCEGGHIQYVRLDNPENQKAVRAMIERGMKRGFYQGVNFDSAYCGDCGEHSTNVLFKCPKCGSSNLSVISRVCGYLGYSNVNGMSRMNDGKMAEIQNRVSM
ncbi:MAG: anaerobic ribonucleoside-triphosphate reductase, partial [Duodenibacillus sp.]